MTLKLNGSSSGYTAIDAPAAAGSNTLVLPTNNGSAGQILQTDGSGNLTWVDKPSSKLLQHKYTKTHYSSNTPWPTSETDISGHSIAMTKLSSGSSKFIFRVNFHVRYNSGSINAWVKIFKGSSCIDSDMDADNGLGYLHGVTDSMNYTYAQMWIADAATDTYKLRHIAGSTNVAFADNSWAWFEISEVDA
mgnify:CR=1 FL=1|tara:strand:- start:54 stop:626 length:573 start_codon:yes stop_codon:yes gene_type:complete